MATAAVPTSAPDTFAQKLATVIAGVQTYVQDAVQQADLQKVKAGQDVLLALYNTVVLKRAAGERLEPSYDRLRLMSEIAGNLSEVSARAGEYNKELMTLGHANEVRLTALPEPIKWEVQAEKARMVFAGKNTWNHRLERHSLTIGEKTYNPLACTDKSWEYELPVIHFKPELHKPTFVEAIFKADWKYTGWLGKATAEYVTEEFKVWLQAAPLCPYVVKAVFSDFKPHQETKPYIDGPFELRGEVSKKAEKDFVIKVPEGWTLNHDREIKLDVLEEGGIYHSVVNGKDNEITVHVSCGDKETAGHLKFSVHYTATRTTNVEVVREESIDLVRGQTRELPTNLKNVTAEGEGGTHSGLEFEGPEVSLKKNQDGTYLLSAPLKV